MDDPQGGASVPSDAKVETATSDSNEKSSIANIDECLRALTKLPVLVLLGIVTPAKSNAMCRVYLTLLQHHWRSVGNGAIHVAAKDKFVELLRQHPEAAEAFVGFLDDAEIARIVRGEGDR